MLVSAKEIADILSGVVVGNPEVRVSSPAKIEEAVEGNISFLANPKYEHFAYTTKASILLVQTDFFPAQEITATLVKVDDVYGSLAKLLESFSPQNGLESGISDLAQIHPEALIAEGVSIGAFTVVGKGVSIGKGCIIFPQVFIAENVVIGEHVTIYPGVRLYRESEIGARSILHSNCVIGSDGFGFSKSDDGSFEKIAQIGKVIIKADVEIGANTVIDRATMGATVIEQGVKLDNLIQIAHNVEIGEHTAIAAQAGIAGSTKIGKQVMIGGQAGFVGHIKIADKVQVQAQSGVTQSIEEENARLYGSPAIEYVSYLKSYALFKQLPELMKKIHSLEKEIERLRGKQ